MDRQSVDSYVKQNKSADKAGGRVKRQSERYNVSFKTHIKLSSGEIVTGLAKNISKGGICIEYDSSADLGLEFELMFDVATGPGQSASFRCCSGPQCIPYCIFVPCFTSGQ